MMRVVSHWNGWKVTDSSISVSHPDSIPISSTVLAEPIISVPCPTDTQIRQHATPVAIRHIYAMHTTQCNVITTAKPMFMMPLLQCA